jgi:hypothetical protein
MNQSDYKPGDVVWLDEGEWCSSLSRVTIVKVFKDGNCQVVDSSGRKRQTNFVRLHKGRPRKWFGIAPVQGCTPTAPERAQRVWCGHEQRFR